ncbi:MAG: rRNA maturation RNase YbeY [candidate division Zixibacteria bacterium]
MSVSLMLSDRRFSLDNRGLSSLIKKVLKGEKALEKSLNIVYCSDTLITDLNKRFKNKARTTDVLAFGMEESSEPKFIGEVYINLAQARRQANELRISYKQEVKRLTIHGVLHLLGYRDGNSRDSGRMWSRQEGYL